jgi:hypothetical protein
VFLAIVSAASFDWTSRGGSVGFDSLTKEEWRALILEKRKKCLMFVDHHSAFETRSGGLTPLELVSLDQVIKTRGRDSHQGGSLHSKLIVALYKNSEDVVIGRIYVGSKNFTSSQMHEFGVVYDLRRDPKHASNRSFIEPFVKYLKYLRDQEGSPAGSIRLRPINHALELFRTESFCIDDRGCAFHWQGRLQKKGQTQTLASQLHHLPRQKWDGIFVHSPWTRQAAVRYIADPMPNVPVRIACLKEPGLSTFKRANVYYQLSYSVTGLVQAHQSHAKVYLFARGDDSVLVFGSANLTPDGWGLPVPGCRPNVEILVATKIKLKNYRYLTEITGKMEGLVPTRNDLSIQEEVLSHLNAIQIRVSFIRYPGHLRYEIDWPENLSDLEEKIIIAHSLIETFGSDAIGEIPIFDGWLPPKEKKIPWAQGDLYRVSSLIRISCPTHSVETHLVVDLDAEFYEGRAQLKVLQYRPKEILESLAQLMDVVMPWKFPTPGSGDGGHEEQLAALLDGIRAERYAYKMSRLKRREPTTYRRTIDRVATLIAAAETDENLSGDPRLRRLIQTVNCIHGELARA